MFTDCAKLNQHINRDSTYNDLLDAQKSECLQCNDTACDSKEFIKEKLLMLEFVTKY